MQSNMKGVLLLKAPVAGVLVPIEEVPDPVFAQKLVGDGISIDPLGETLCAPCDGEIIHVHPAGHAVTLKVAEGLDIYDAEARNLQDMSNELLAQRATDLRDVGQRVLQLLSGVEASSLQYTSPCILIAEDLTPSDTVTLDRNVVRGFCTTLGGTTSHVAILARSLGIPAVAGIDPGVLALEDGSEVILDGSAGTLRANPSPVEIKRIRGVQEQMEQKRKADLMAAHEPAITSDGRRVDVFANIGGLSDAKQVAELGGEGVGLLRSEFFFMDRVSAPSEDEQVEVYGAIMDALGAGRPLIIRTLDVGGGQAAHVPADAPRGQSVPR